MPGAPFWPAAPGGPCAPGSPFAPCGPVGPVWFQVSGDSLLAVQVWPVSMTRSAPPLVAKQPWIVPSAAAIAATAAPTPIAANATSASATVRRERRANASLMLPPPSAPVGRRTDSRGWHRGETSDNESRATAASLRAARSTGEHPTVLLVGHAFDVVE